VSLYLYAQLLKVLYYRTVDCTAEVSVLIRDDTSFVADAIIHILTVTQSHKRFYGGSKQRNIHVPEDPLRQGTDWQSGKVLE